MTKEMINEQINLTIEGISKIFKQLNSPNQTKSDPQYGRHTFSVFLRMDELDIEQLEASIPALKQLMIKYKLFREEEKKLYFETHLSKTLTPTLNP